jgi:hypothetical protein
MRIGEEYSPKGGMRMRSILDGGEGSGKILSTQSLPC